MPCGITSVDPPISPRGASGLVPLPYLAAKIVLPGMGHFRDVPRWISRRRLAHLSSQVAGLRRIRNGNSESLAAPRQDDPVLNLLKTQFAVAVFFHGRTLHFDGLKWLIGLRFTWRKPVKTEREAVRFLYFRSVLDSLPVRLQTALGARAVFHDFLSTAKFPDLVL